MTLTDWQVTEAPARIERLTNIGKPRSADKDSIHGRPSRRRPVVSLLSKQFANPVCKPKSLLLPRSNQVGRTGKGVERFKPSTEVQCPIHVAHLHNDARPSGDGVLEGVVYRDQCRVCIGPVRFADRWVLHRFGGD
ncbi:hypothetical protein [Antrihabitans spumae]|uniref:Uncharacterized protein n=1 Tax=Antrihabitans spumae TaxID=3373370 RepID=A0ABW7JYR0_9NOCA